MNDTLLLIGTFALGTGQGVLRNTGSIQQRQESTGSTSTEFFTAEKRGAWPTQHLRGGTENVVFGGGPSMPWYFYSGS